MRESTQSLEMAEGAAAESDKQATIGAVRAQLGRYKLHVVQGLGLGFVLLVFGNLLYFWSTPHSAFGLILTAGGFLILVATLVYSRAAWPPVDATRAVKQRR